MNISSPLFEIYPEAVGATIPLGIRTGDLVYAGGLSGTDPVTGVPVGSLAEQTEFALRQLAAAVEGAGGSTDNIGRAVAYVTKAEDRLTVYDSWDAMFPDENDRPAFKVLVADPPPGHLVRIDGLAILGTRRERTDIAGVPARDPTVKCGDWLFTSRVHGIHPEADVPEEVEAEAVQNFENLATLLDVNGFQPSDMVQITIFGNDGTYFDLAQQAFSQIFPDAAPAMVSIASPLAPKFKVSAEVTAVKGCADGAAPFAEIYIDPAASAAPDGVRLGDFIVAPGLYGGAGDAETQMRAACTNMEAFAKAAGGGLDDITRVAVYMATLEDRPVLNEVWVEWYPEMDDRPPHKYAAAALPVGRVFRFLVLGVLNTERQCLVIPGMQHGDPMSMGVRSGNLIASSRIFGSHAHTGERAKDATEAADLVFTHVATLLADGGAGWTNLTQLTAFIGEAEFRPLIEERWSARTAGLGNAPHLNVIVTTLAGGPNPRVEILALA
ncbi:MAG: RidA family protein [Pseudomonadota bacterium]|nr:RidA family protein [Pseudomonadota bacterium]